MCQFVKNFGEGGPRIYYLGSKVRIFGYIYTSYFFQNLGSWPPKPTHSSVPSDPATHAKSHQLTIQPYLIREDFCFLVKLKKTLYVPSKSPIHRCHTHTIFFFLFPFALKMTWIRWVSSLLECFTSSSSVKSGLCFVRVGCCWHVVDKTWLGVLENDSRECSPGIILIKHFLSSCLSFLEDDWHLTALLTGCPFGIF